MNVTTFLMFEGQAEEAMRFYVSLLPGSSIVSIQRYGAGEPGPEGSVKHALFDLAGTRYACIDSPAKHEFTFTPSVSLFVNADSREQLDELIGKLGEGGKFLMPPEDYGFSQWFAWLQDRFGVSWQLNFS